MLNYGAMRARVCGGWTRRALLQAGGISALGLSWPAFLRARQRRDEGGPQAENAGGFGTAKSCILLWLWGGPSHLDTFDMKPQAPLDYRGPYAPIATSVPGIDVCELFPKLARQAERFTLLRSLKTASNDHGIAGTIGLTGHESGGISLGGATVPGRLQPAHGAVVLRARGASPAVPRFVALGGFLHQGHRAIAGEGGGVFGPSCDPFRLDYDPAEGVKLPELSLREGVTRSGLASRRSLLQQFEAQWHAVERTRAIDQLDEFYQQAFSLLTTDEARRVFDLAQEPDAARRRYGRFRFGQCCLLARRLVEAGVSFVQVNWSSHVEPIEDAGDGGWDMHDRNFIQLQERHSWMLDQAASALLDDLAQRGLLESTLVLAVGEFGRTPKINGKAGRDHWESCYTALLAGGGIPGGQVIGASDKLAEYPASRPATPAELAVTVYHRLGIGTPQLTSMGLTPGGEAIEELL